MNRNHINAVMTGYGILLGIGLLILIFWSFQNDRFPETFFGLPSELVLFIAVPILAIPFYFLKKQKAHIHTHELKLAAYGNGWQYKKELELPFLKWLVKLLKIRSTHPLKSTLSNFLTGKINGWNFVICEGEYDDGGEDSHIIRQTIFALNIKDADLPLFGLEPETFGSRLHNVFAGFDIDFGSHPTFSKNYALYGENKDHIRQLFKDEVLNFFEPLKDISVFAHQNHLVTFRKKKICRPALLESELNFLIEIAKLLLRNNKFEKRAIKPIKSRLQKDNVQYW